MQSSLLYFSVIYHIWGKQHYEALFLSYTADLGQNAVFHNFAKKNCTHSIFWTIEARASFAQNIKELTTLENVFWKTEFHNVETGSHNNLLLCGIQGNNGLLAKLFKKIPKWLFRLAGSHFWHRQIWNASHWEFEWILIELRFSIKGVIMFILDYGFLPMCNL